MYRIIRFKGGVYRFDELSEYLEDAGGMLFQEDRLHIIRGSSFITQELQVIMILPPDELEQVTSLAEDIKGQIEEDLNLDPQEEMEMLHYFYLYHTICQADEWANLSLIKELTDKLYHAEDPLPDLVYLNYFNDSSAPEDFRKSLDIMCNLELLEVREQKGKPEYRIKRK
ncbi:MAG: methyl-coenzyme M reductase family protein [Methanobacteriaceae archaeon]